MVQRILLSYRVSGPKAEDEHQIAGWTWGLRPSARSNFDEKDNFALTYSLAGRLCDQLLADNIAVRKIIYGEHLVAKQTAAVYKDVLDERQVNRKVLGIEDTFSVEMHESRALSPGLCTEWATDQINISLKCQGVADRKGGRPVSAAFVLVGRQPELTTIARRWLESALPFNKLPRLPLNTLPIDGSEAACLGFGAEPRLYWLITNKQKALMDDVKDKINSKYDVAKFFLGAFVVNTGLILNAGV
jgi:hypothetical protein